MDSGEVNGKQREGRDYKINTKTKLYKCLSSAACRSNGSVQQEQAGLEKQNMSEVGSGWSELGSEVRYSRK